ncbi:creatininase family protein [uncultured Microbacterium sp.]|uniref:creatininase family protein n=1 Tax=uncultured Microbacterium sp. TaxID=191216 RepID=UPI00260B5422|nr:creatininase family protein [uncultured Microbacterium sp.]
MSVLRSRRWGDLSGPALTEALTSSSILVLPVGAIEHHGGHLPLSTDLVLAEEIAARIVGAATQAGHDVWLLPALGVTKSDEHAWAPGTLWLSGETFARVLVDLGRSIAATPARTVLFYNGHGGNIAPLNVALRELRRQFGLNTFLDGVRVPGGPDERGFGIHGGHGETSLLMHLRPDLVDTTAATRAVPDALAGFERIGFAASPVQFGWCSDDFASGGVIGDPTTATAAEGAALAARLVEDGVATIDEISRWPIGPRAV